MTELQLDQRDGRRAHRKSKNGCVVCKRRRVKCDEKRPQCGKCAIGNRACSYQDEQSSSGVSTPSTAFGGSDCSVGSVSRTDVRLAAQAENEELGTAAVGAGSSFSSIHMVLMHHAETYLADSIPLNGSTRPVIDAAVDNAFAAPYLLDQLLALSALHLSTLDPATTQFYRYQATKLQTRALGLFTQVKGDISDSNCIPSFLFAALLGIHVLRDTLSHQDRSLGEFVSAFVDYARLHRGIRAVTNQHWPRICQSELKPVLYITDWTDKSESLSPGTETDKLRGFLQSSPGLSPSSVEACLSAQKWVQWVLDVSALEPSRFDVAVQVTTAWPLVIPDEYIDALYQHRPEALVVLAYYAAILHRHRRFWIFDGAGSTLIQLITSHVGCFWTDCLAWPRQLLLED